MGLHINRDRFFRKMTLKIAGCMEIEIALQRCLDTLADIMPVDLMAFHQYTWKKGVLTTLAVATSQGVKTINHEVVLQESIRQQIEARWSTRVWVIDRLGDDPVAAETADFLDAADASAMLMDLTLGGKLTGIVSVANHRGHGYNTEQVALLTALNEPLALAFMNGIRFKELQRMRDLLAEDNRMLKDELSRATTRPVIGGDLGLKPVIDQVNRTAALENPVLLLGETGTGKEVIARVIHASSTRSQMPFVSVNCGSLSHTLADSELFGHEKGAFTGATNRHKGFFERAHGGTLFLDEIGELPNEIQVRLLRVLQEQEINRVGGSHPVSINARIIAATHRNLEALVRKGRFRQDLYFRIRIFPIRIPPLRERREDIEPLLHHFVKIKSVAMNKLPIPEIDTAAAHRLQNYHWPGNVRELENMVERALILHSTGPLIIEPFESEFDCSPKSSSRAVQRPKTLSQVMAAHIRRTLDHAGGRVEGRGGAAELLDVHPSTLRVRMRKLGIPFGRKYKPPE
jgi:transcriptional regulator with GAF, ATPase, and Fis domain